MIYSRDYIGEKRYKIFAPSNESAIPYSDARIHSPRSMQQAGSIDMMRQPELPGIVYYEYYVDVPADMAGNVQRRIVTLFYWNRRQYGPKSIIILDNDNVIKKDFVLNGKETGGVEWEKYRAARDDSLIKNASKTV